MALQTGSNVTVSLSLSSSIFKALGGGTFGTPSIPSSFPSIGGTLSLGTGANNFNMLFELNQSVASGTPVDIDLTGQTAPDGSAIALADIVGIALQFPAANTANITVGNAAANAWSAWLGATGTLVQIPGSAVFLFAPVASGSGYTVDGTHKLLRLTAASGTQVANVWGFGH